MSAFLGAQPPPEYFLGAEPPLELFSGSATAQQITKGRFFKINYNVIWKLLTNLNDTNCQFIKFFDCGKFENLSMMIYYSNI
jgi:hypothetical protein